jgi:hypothetical protein
MPCSGRAWSFATEVEHRERIAEPVARPEESIEVQLVQLLETFLVDRIVFRR